MFNRKSTSKSQPRMVPLRYVLTPIAIIFSAIVILIIVGAMAPKPAKKPVDIKDPLVEVQPLVKSSMTFTIRSQGSITPRTETNLVSEVSGQVVSVSEKFKVGGFFKQGEELLAIDDINYQVALVQAQARLGSAEANLLEEQARVEQAEEEWLLSGKPLNEAPLLATRKPQLQKAKADVKAAKADLQQAQIKLKRTHILAPYDAMLKQKNVDIGQYVTTGNSLAMTFAVDYAEVRLPVKQRDVLFLDLPKINKEKTKGSAVDLHLSVGPNTFHWASEISRYEGVVDDQSRVHYVVAQLDDPYAITTRTNERELRIGTFVNASIEGSTVDGVVAIPRSAISGANTIYLLAKDNTLHIQTVSVLHADSNNIYTQDDLDLSKRLVITRIETPIEGMSLRVKGENTTPETTKPQTSEQNGESS